MADFATIITRTLLLDFLYLLEISLLLLTVLITCISFWLLSFTCRLFTCNVRDNVSSSVTVNRLSLRIILAIRFSLFCTVLVVHSHAIVNTENLNGWLLSSFDVMTDLYLKPSRSRRQLLTDSFKFFYLCCNGLTIAYAKFIELLPTTLFPILGCIPIQQMQLLPHIAFGVVQLTKFMCRLIHFFGFFF